MGGTGRMAMDRRLTGFGFVVVILMLLAGAQPAAHHSFAAEFDDTKPVKVTGTITKVEWQNPHIWFYIDVKNADGSVTTWGFEAEGPSTLTRAGIKKSDFMPGTELSITGHPMRDGRPAASWIKATRGDGKDFDPRNGFAIK